MSEQNQSNFQALGAGLLGFVAVMTLGGGALMVHSSQQAKSAARPVAAAAPIDLGASLPRPALSSPRASEERRAESPAPLIGEDRIESLPSPIPPGAREGVAQASADASAAPGLEVTSHLDAAGNGSSAKAVVKNTIAPEKPAAKAAGRKALPKPVPAGASSETVASVHYGVTSRSELMGRAAGPVYNVKGGSAKGGSIAAGKMADANGKLADIQKQLEAAGLPADQRAKLQKDLADATKDLSDAAQ